MIAVTVKANINAVQTAHPKSYSYFFTEVGVNYPVVAAIELVDGKLACTLDVRTGTGTHVYYNVLANAGIWSAVDKPDYAPLANGQRDA